MRWLIILMVIGGACAWLTMRGIDQGVEVLQDATALRERERQRVAEVAAALREEGRNAVVEGAAAAATVHATAQERLAEVLPPAPVRPAPPPPVPVDGLLGAGKDAVERRLGSPTGRVRQADGTEEWWYDRRVLVFRDGRVIHWR